MKLLKNLQLSAVIVSIPWLVYIIDFATPVDLRRYGLRPRHLEGLWGIVFSPFLHGNLNHLIANTGVLFVLLLVSLSFSRRLTAIVISAVAFLGGGLVWIFGRAGTIHIGSSGIIFGLLGFLLFIGVFRREKMALIISLITFVLYGGAMLSLFHHIPGISWASHFFGFVAGALAASWTSLVRPR
jgi:membrane associated rhomboid family serine protease